MPKAGQLLLQICDFLAAAPAQAAALAAPGAADLLVDSGGAAAHAAAAARAYLASLWTQKPSAEPCRALVERYTPLATSSTAHGPREAVRRLEHVATTSTTLRLPRGRSVLRIVADPNYLHQVSVFSADKFTLALPPAVLTAADGAHTLEATERLPALPAGGWRVAARHALRAPTACRAAVSLRAAPDATQRHVRVLVVDNSTRVATELVLGEVEALPLVPNADGYTIMALESAPADTPLPEGSYRLRVTSDAPLAGFSALPCARCDAFEGVYEASQRANVWTYIVNAVQACAVALKLTSSLRGAAGTLTLAPAPAEPGKGGKAPPAAAAAAAAGAGGDGAQRTEPQPLLQLEVGSEAEVPYLLIPAGRSTLTLSLARDRCAFEVLPNGELRAAGGGVGDAAPLELRWKMFIAAPVEEKACSFARDTSGAAQRAAQLKEWVDRGAGGAKLRPKNAEAAVAAHAAAQRAAAAAGGAARVTRTVGGKQVELSANRTNVTGEGDASDEAAPADVQALLAARAEELQRAEAANAAAAAALVDASKAEARALLDGITRAEAARAGARDAAAAAADALQAQRAAVLDRLKHEAVAASVRAA